MQLHGTIKPDKMHIPDPSKPPRAFSIGALWLPMSSWDRLMIDLAPQLKRDALFVELALKDTGRMQEFMIKELRQPL